MKKFPLDQEIHQQYYEEIVTKLKKDPFAKQLGIRLLSVGEGTATAEVKVNEHMLNMHGTAHGAIIFALADVVFAVASNSYGRTAVALSMNIGFMAASFAGERLRATAIEEKKNHRTSWYRIKVENEKEVIAILDALAYRKKDYFVRI